MQRKSHPEHFMLHRSKETDKRNCSERKERIEDPEKRRKGKGRVGQENSRKHLGASSTVELAILAVIQNGSRQTSCAQVLHV